jgi:hypothetical protein
MPDGVHITRLSTNCPHIEVQQGEDICAFLDAVGGGMNPRRQLNYPPRSDLTGGIFHILGYRLLDYLQTHSMMDPQAKDDVTSLLQHRTSPDHVELKGLRLGIEHSSEQMATTSFPLDRHLKTTPLKLNPHGIPSIRVSLSPLLPPGNAYTRDEIHQMLAVLWAVCVHEAMHIAQWCEMGQNMLNNQDHSLECLPHVVSTLVCMVAFKMEGVFSSQYQTAGSYIRQHPDSFLADAASACVSSYNHSRIHGLVADICPWLDLDVPEVCSLSRFCRRLSEMMTDCGVLTSPLIQGWKSWIHLEV